MRLGRLVGLGPPRRRPEYVPVWLATVHMVRNRLRSARRVLGDLLHRVRLRLGAATAPSGDEQSTVIVRLRLITRSQLRALAESDLHDAMLRRAVRTQVEAELGAIAEILGSESDCFLDEVVRMLALRLRAIEQLANEVRDAVGYGD